MSRKWVQLLVVEAVALAILVKVLPAWNTPKTTSWEPVQWRTETSPVQRALLPTRHAAIGAEGRQAADQIPTPPAPSYYAPRFEGAAPMAATPPAPQPQRSEYVRQRLARSSAEFGAVVNRTLRNSLPPEWDGESLASHDGSVRYPADAWPRR